MTEDQYNECVTRYADNVYRFILKNLRHEEDARDVVQNAFEKLWRHRDDVVYEKSKSYLFTVAYNQMIDHIRKSKRTNHRDITENEDVAWSHQPHSKDVSKILHTALYKLNDLQRSLVLLKDYEGYNYEEIGVITGLNQSQVKVYLHRARLTLRNYLVSVENVL